MQGKVLDILRKKTFWELSCWVSFQRKATKMFLKVTKSIEKADK